MNEDKLEYLEGLRGSASVIVLICHLRNAFFVSFPNSLIVQSKGLTDFSSLSYVAHSLLNVFFDGSLAVYIFWFMSAYVISIKLFKEENKSYLLFSFVKRYFRLAVPVLGSVLIAYLLLRFHLMYNLKLSQHLGAGYEDGWLGRFYSFQPSFFGAIKRALWNTFFLYDYEIDYNPNLWSMNPELYGSFFVFFIFGIFGKHKFRYMVYLLLIIGAFQLKNYPLISFILGFLLCDLDYSGGNRFSIFLNRLFSNQIVNIILFSIVLLIAGQSNFFGFFDLLVGTAIVLIVLKTKVLQLFFRNRILVWLGRISFSLYLIHMPVICSFACFLYLWLPIDNPAKVTIVISLTVFVCLFVSHLFTRYVDDTGVKYSNKLAKEFVKE